MRLALVALVSLSLLGCKKKGPQPTLPVYPGASPMAHGGNVEMPEGTLFHMRWRTTDHAGQVMRFYADEMERRGAHADGTTYQHENMPRTQGGVTAKDPGKPGVALSVDETDRETIIEVYEMVPKQP